MLHQVDASKYPFFEVPINDHSVLTNKITINTTTLFNQQRTRKSESTLKVTE